MKFKLTNLKVKQKYSLGKLGFKAIRFKGDLEDVVIEPSLEDQIIRPSANKDGIGQVTVKAISSDYVLPKGLLEITTNGTYDVAEYAEALVKTTDRLQWKCDNLKSLAYEFYNTNLTDYNHIVAGLDTSKVTNFTYLFYNCMQFESVDLLHFDVSNATTMYGIFYYCLKLKRLDLSTWHTPKLTSIERLFSDCRELEDLDISNFNTSKATNVNAIFYDCRKLKKIETIDMYSVTYVGTPFYNCKALETLTIKNIRKALVIGSGTSYGTLINKDSLINTIKELWDYSSGTTTYTLTMSTASKELIADVYVKLVDVTDEMLAKDQYADKKKPCVVCESTDEGAMTLTEYAISKMWNIA